MSRFSLKIYLILLFLLALNVVSYANELNIGDKAIEFPDGNKWFGGDKASIENNIGKKITLLYFMKPGCGSCDKFAPHLYRLMLKHKNNLSVVGVTEFSDDKIEEYLLKRKGDYPILQDKDRTFMSKYIGVINKYPYVAIINKEGLLSWFGRGKFHSHVTDEVNKALGVGKDSAAVNPDGAKRSLVVGVDYSDLTLNKLQSPENNAKLISEVFTKNGYTEDTLVIGEDLTKEKLISEIEKLAADSKVDDTAVFFFSGDAKPLEQVDGSFDLKIFLPSSSISLKELVDKFKSNSKCKNFLVIIDANTEKSSLKIWEDIAADLGKGIPDATIILSAARWDRSMLNDNKTETVFSEMLAKSIENSSAESTPYRLWRVIRDEMSVWSRPKGVLQSPFIVNANDFSIGVNK